MGIIDLAGGVHAELVITIEPCKSLQHLDAHALVGLQGHLAAILEHLPAGLLQGLPVEAWFCGSLHAEAPVVGPVAHAIRSRPPGLRGDAAPPETLSARQRGIIDHRDLYTVPGQIARAVFSAGTAPDHNDIVVPVAGGNGGSRGAHPAHGVLDASLEGIEVEGHLGTVDHAMVGGNRKGHALLSSRADGKNGGRPRGWNGVELAYPEHAHVGDLEGGVGILLGLETTLARPLHQIAPVPVELLEAAGLAAPKHGHHQPAALGGHRHTDIHLVAFHQPVFRLVGPVDLRMVLHRQRASLGDGHGGRHPGTLCARHQGLRPGVNGHVKGGHSERADHRSAHRAFHRAHGPAFTGHRYRRGRCPWLHASAGSTLLRLPDILPRDRAFGAAALQGVEIDSRGTCQLARIRRRLTAPRTRRRACAPGRGFHGFRTGRGGLAPGFGRRRRGWGFDGGLTGRSLRLLLAVHLFRAFHQISQGLAHRHRAVYGRTRPRQVAFAEDLHVHDRLVRLHGGDHVTPLDLVTDGFLPAHDHAFGHGVRELGHLDHVGLGHVLVAGIIDDGGTGSARRMSPPPEIHRVRPRERRRRLGPCADQLASARALPSILSTAPATSPEVGSARRSSERA